MDFGHGDSVRRDGRGRIRPGLFEREKKAGTRERVAAVSLYGGRAWRIGRSIPDYPKVHGGFMVSLRLWPRPGHGRGVRAPLQRTGSPGQGVARAIRLQASPTRGDSGGICCGGAACTTKTGRGDRADEGVPPVIERKYGTRGWRAGPTRRCPRVCRAGTAHTGGEMGWCVGFGEWAEMGAASPTGNPFLFLFIFLIPNPT